MMTRFRKITSALVIASVLGAGTAYAAVKYLRDFSAVVGITDNDNTFWCQVVGGCQATDPLKRVTMAQIWQYVFSKVTGDFTINSSTGVGTLANTAVTPGTYGDSTHVSQVTLDSKGRATGAASVAIAGGAGGTVNVVKDASTTVTSPPQINYTAGCVVTNVAGNANVACSGGGGGSGAVNSGTLGQIPWYAATGTTVSGNPNISVLGGSLVTNFNAVALPAPPSGTTVAQFGAADGNQTRIVADSFGTGVSSVFTGRSARGTNASKTAVQTNDVLSAFTGFGYGTTGYSTTYRGRFGISAAENWTDAAQGTRAVISTAANTTTTVSDRVAVENDGGVTVAADATGAPPTGGSKGPGTVNAANGFYDNNVRVNTSAATVTNTSGPLALHAPMIGNGGADSKTTAVLTNGQVLCGSTGVDPVPCTLAAGTPNLAVTTSAGGLSIASTAPINDISSSGTPIVTGDNTKIDKLGAFTYTLAQAGTAGFGAGWGVCLLNVGAGNSTINATTSTFVGAGGSTTLVLAPGAWACPTSDGSNYQTPEGNNIVAGTNITVTRNANGTLTIAASGGGTLIPNSIGGCGLSNDGGTPNTVLDIAACTAADSTNTVLITQASAFTKSIAGAWAAGTGSNGMGNGLTATASTWYHVCFGNSDYWFDTAAACTNRPAGLSGTDKRRVSAILLDGSVNIRAFKQKGDLFVWSTPVVNASAQTYTTSNTNVTLSAPPGVPSEVAVIVFLGVAGSDSLFLYDPDAATSSNYAACPQDSVNTVRCSVIVTPSIAGAVVAVGTGSGSIASNTISTMRYRDFRGQ